MNWNPSTEPPAPADNGAESDDVLAIAGSRYHVAYYDGVFKAWYTSDGDSTRTVVEGVECWTELPDLEVERHNRVTTAKVIRYAKALGDIRKQVWKLECDERIVLECTAVSQSTVEGDTYDVFRLKEPDWCDYWAVRLVGDDGEFGLYPADDNDEAQDADYVAQAHHALAPSFPI